MLQTKVKDLENEIGDLKQQLAVSDQKHADHEAEFHKFKLWVGSNELKRRRAEKEQLEKEKLVTVTDPGNESGSDSENSDRDVVMTEAEKAKIEASAAAAGSNVLKVSLDLFFG